MELLVDISLFAPFWLFCNPSSHHPSPSSVQPSPITHIVAIPSQTTHTFASMTISREKQNLFGPGSKNSEC